MKSKGNFFKCKYIKLSNKSNLHLVNIKKIDSNLEKYLDDSIVSICEGDSSSSINAIKKVLIDTLKSKRGSVLEMGAAAEFFTHLYLKSCGFKQEFLYLNLEERSAKKGFDGYYSFSGEEWLYESKSGTSSSKSISHPGKIKKAYDDLKGKVSKKGKNNPWKNAYNHACHIDVGANRKIRENIKKLSDDYINDKFYEVKEFNIIPSSTIFLEGSWKKLKQSAVKNDLDALIAKFDYKGINVICINKRSVDLFWNYLNK